MSYTLACLHTLPGRAPHYAVPGYLMWCEKCRQRQAFVIEHQQIHSVRCDSCTYSRLDTGSLFVAERLAQRHTNSRGHVVKVYSDSELMSEKRPNVLTLDADAEPPY